MKRWILLLVVVMGGAFVIFSNASVAMDREATLHHESNKLYLMNNGEKVLLELYKDSYDYSIHVLDEVYVVVGETKVLGGTGYGYTVNIVDNHNKVLHDTELPLEVILSDETLRIRSKRVSEERELKTFFDTLRVDDASGKIHIIKNEPLTLTDISGFEVRGNDLYLRFEVKNTTTNYVLTSVFIKMEDGLKVTDIAFGDFQQGFEVFNN